MIVSNGWLYIQYSNLHKEAHATRNPVVPELRSVADMTMRIARDNFFVSISSVTPVGEERVSRASRADMKKMATLLPDATAAYCDKGSHLCMWDDQESYFTQLLAFLRTV
jgi:hypothetical protein